MTITSFYLDPSEVHDNVFLPNTLTPLALSPAHYSSVTRTLQNEERARAEGRRLKAFPKRGDFTFPVGVLYDEKHSLVPLATRVFRWSQRIAMADLYEHGSIPVDDLAERVLEAIYAHGGDRIRPDYYEPVESGLRPYVLLGSMLDRMALKAAAKALEGYAPELKPNLKKWGAKGGSLSKRPPEFTIADLAGIEDLHWREQMARVGCKRARIFELRKELAAYRGRLAEETERAQVVAYRGLPVVEAPEGYRAPDLVSPMPDPAEAHREPLDRVTDLTIWREGKDQPLVDYMLHGIAL